MGPIFDHEQHQKHKFWNTAPVNPLAEAKKRGLAYTSRKPLMADSPFPFGEHLGKTMRQVPPDFLRWVDEQPWADTWHAWAPVRDYLQRHPLPEPKDELQARPVSIYVSPIRVDPGARGVFREGAARLYVAQEAHLEPLRCFAAGALDLRVDWMRAADATAPPHFLVTPEKQARALGLGAELVTLRQMDEHTWHWRRTHSGGTTAQPTGHEFVRIRPDGSQQCTKHCYATKKEADTAVNYLTEGRRQRRRQHPTYLRAYQCYRCGFWHITKQPLRGNDE